MKLARRIIAIVLAAFLVLLGLVGAFEAGRSIREHDARIAAELAATGRALRPSFAEVLHVEGPSRANDLLERANADLPNIRVRWLALREMPEDEREHLASGEEVKARSASNRLLVYVPLPPDGVIELSQERDERSAIVAVAERRLLDAIVAVAAAILLSAILGVGLVGGPMKLLVEQARRIGAGDLSTRLTLRRKDEIGELAVEMNGMCDRLAEAQERLGREADARIRAVEQLRHADRLGTVGRLASGMAHELGTPLSVIGGRAKMIANGEVDGEEAQRCARTIVGQADRVARIMRDLLDFARRKRSPKTPADLREVAKRTRELLAPLATKSGIEVRVQEGPDAVAPVEVEQVEQALANLVVNGIHAMPNGGELVLDAQRVRGKPPEGADGKEADYVRVSVRDSGQGIAEEDLPHVFEPFFTTKDVGEGTGLGLSVTYGIMQDHAGFIQVESKRGRGSCFSLYFPAENGMQSGQS